MRPLELALLIVSIFAIVSSGIMVHHWTNSINTNVGTTKQQNASVSYTLGIFSVTVLQNATVKVSSNSVTITIKPTIYSTSGGKFVKEALKSGKLNRIDNRNQNSVALIDQYSGTQMTYGYNLQGSKLSLTLISTGGSPYAGIDITTPKVTSASGGTTFFGGLNTHEYGKYVIGNEYSSFYESFQQASLSFSWFQFTAINEFDYGSFSLSSNSTSLDLMFGPLYSNGVTLNSGPLTISTN